MSFHIITLKKTKMSRCQDVKIARLILCTQKVVALMISSHFNFSLFFLKLTADVLPLQPINFFTPKNN